jgi:sigma-B regulation protein RsbU (phosphoserine phosphatase)
MLGADALQEILVAKASLPLAEAGDAVFDTVDRFCNGAAQFDDMTLLMLDIPLEQPAALQSRRADFVIDAEVCTRAMAWFRQEWQSLGLWDEDGRELLLVLEELVCNVRDHSRADASAELQLCLECFADHVRLICEDPAPAYNPLLEGSRAALGVQTIDAEVGGLGLHLITSLTDAQFYRRENGRNILEVRRRTIANDTRTIT